MKNYIEAIRMMIKTEGLEATNAANHKALETGLIDLQMFQAAARILAKEIMNR